MRVMLLVAGVGLLAGVAQAVPYNVSNTTSSTDFESWTVGDTINQYTDEGDRGLTWSADDEWVGSPEDFDEEIVSTGSNKAWRVSAAAGGGGFSGEPWTPSVVAVGEPGSHLWNDRGSDHTSPLDPPNENGSPVMDVFTASFDFKSETDALQEDLFLSVSPGPRQSSFRQSYIGLDAESDNASGGMDITFYETVDGGGFQSHTVAEGLDPSVFHNVKIRIRFHDGVNGDGTGNDEVDVWVNDTQELTGVSTWETYYRNTSAFSDTPEVAVDSLLFNLNDGGPNTLDHGLLFDNVNIEATPEPATLGLLALGGLALIRRRRTA